MCQQNPKAPDCNLPLYWAAPTVALPASAGNASRRSGICATIPIAERARGPRRGRERQRRRAASHLPGDGCAVGAARRVHRASHGRAESGYEQPLTLRLDPRVTTPAAGLAQLVVALHRDVRRCGGRARRVHARARTSRAPRERSARMRRRWQGEGGCARTPRSDADADARASAPRAAKPEGVRRRSRALATSSWPRRWQCRAQTSRPRRIRSRRARARVRRIERDGAVERAREAGARVAGTN